MPNMLCKRKYHVLGLEQEKDPPCSVVLAHTCPCDWLAELRAQMRQNVPGYSELYLHAAESPDKETA